MPCSAPKQVQQAALPLDASCEDLQIDASLPFLSAYVQQALANGAAPYISQQQRTSMGVMPSSRHHDIAEQPHALRFAAYERTAAPGMAVSQGSPTHQAYSAGSPSGSPVKGQHSRLSL